MAAEKNPVAGGPDAFSGLGFFMVAWSSLETLIEVAIGKLLGVNDQVAEIATSSLGFMGKSNVLTSLLKLNGLENEEAVKLLAQIASNAKRNAIVHGRVFMTSKGSITFVKSSIGNGYRAKKYTFSPEQLTNHAKALTEDAIRLQQLLGITEEELEKFSHVGYTKSSDK